MKKNGIAPFICVFLITGFIVSCGGGGGGGTTSSTTTPIGTAVNLGQVKSYEEASGAPGTTATFNLAGASNQGVQFAATVSFTITGPTTTTTSAGTQTVNVGQQYLSITNKSTGATVSGISTLYVFLTGYLYKIEYDDGSVATPTSQTLLPAFAKVGDFGTYTALSVSDGSNETSSWRIDAGTNGDAILVLSYTSTNSLNPSESFTEEDDFTIKPDGTVSALTLKLNYPSLGVTVTLSGNRM
ncbi:MAG TPA: hypothetical protein VF893_06070 [Candidatus Bathyarchaeia archaeon]